MCDVNALDSNAMHWIFVWVMGLSTPVHVHVWCMVTVHFFNIFLPSSWSIWLRYMQCLRCKSTNLTENGQFWGSLWPFYTGYVCFFKPLWLTSKPDPFIPATLVEESQLSSTEASLVTNQEALLKRRKGSKWTKILGRSRLFQGGGMKPHLSGGQTPWLLIIVGAHISAYKEIAGKRAEAGLPMGSVVVWLTLQLPRGGFMLISTWKSVDFRAS